MKYSEIPQEVLKACPCLIGEHRGSVIERVEWVDKQDGTAKGFVKATHLFEIGQGSVIQSIRIDEPIARNIEDPKQVKPLFKRGSKYLLSLQSLKKEKGNLDGRLVAGSVPVELV